MFGYWVLRQEWFLLSSWIHDIKRRNILASWVLPWWASGCASVFLGRPRYIQAHPLALSVIGIEFYLKCLDKIRCEFSTTKQEEIKGHISICHQTLRFRCTAPTLAGNLSFKCLSVGTPITPRYSDPIELKTFHQRIFYMPVKPFVTAPGHLKSARVRTCLCLHWVRCRTFWTFVVNCDLIVNKVSTGNLYCKCIIAAVSEILRRVFISTIRQTKPYRSSMLVLFDTVTCCCCSLQPLSGRTLFHKKSKKGEACL